MATASVLRAFLRDVISSHERLQILPHPACESRADWLEYLGVHLAITAVPMRGHGDIARNYWLLLGRHREWGLQLVKYTPSLTREPVIRYLSLEDGVERTTGLEDEELLEDISILFEAFDVGRPFTVWSIGHFIFKPVRRMLRQAFLLQAMLAFASSLFFIINFNILSYVVPSQSMRALGAVTWLIAALVITIFLTHLVMTKVRLYLDSVADEREDSLSLSLLWSLHPQLVGKIGPVRVMELCRVLAKAGRGMSEVYLTAISSLAIVPVLVLMYLRLPTILFVLTIFFAIVSFALQTWVHLKQKRKTNTLSLEEVATSGLIFKMTSFAARLKFYGHISSYMERWKVRQVNHVANVYRLSREASLTTGIGLFLNDFVTLLGIFILTFAVAHGVDTGNPVTVSQAFLILHLVTTTYMMVPRLANTVERIGDIRIDLNFARDLLDDLQAARKLEKTKVTSPSTRVTCSELTLPFHCEFSDGNGLNIDIKDKAVVQICGESGSGKSTFLRCLLGLQEPLSGSISIFGTDPMGLSAEERARIFGYVSQDVQLLPGSLRDNLGLFGIGVVRERDIWNALEQVHLLEQINLLPMGLDTPIADSRRNFSTGERQRIVLAQTIIKKSAILVLDEAMSGLSANMEREIFANIRDNFDQIFFVSHREHLRDYANQTIWLGRKEE